MPGAFLLISAPSLSGQGIADDLRAGEDVVELPPFEVRQEADEGFAPSTAIGGTRTREELRDIPLSIQVINTELLESFAASDLTQAVELIDGVEWDGAFVNAYRYRGFFSGGRQVDFFNWAPPTNAYNLDRIESISGPMSLLYGSIDPGGVINEITKNPIFGDRLNVLRAEYGSNEWRRVLVDSNMPLGRERAVRVNAFYQSTEDFRDWKEREWYAVAPSFRMRLGQRFLLTLKGEAGRFLDNFQDNSMVFQVSSVNRLIAFPLKYYVDSPVVDTLRDFYDRYGELPVNDRTYGAWGGPDQLNKVRYYTFTSSLIWEPAAGTAVDFVYNYQNYDRDYFGPAQVNQVKLDPNGYYVNRLWEQDLQDISSHNARITASRDMNFGWTQQRLTGMVAWEYGDQKKIRSWAHRADGSRIYDTLYLADGNAADQTAAPPVAERETWSWVPLFGNPTFDNRTELTVGYLVATGRYLNGRLRSLAGLRYDRLEETVRRSRANHGYSQPSSRSTSAWSPTVGLVYSISETIDVFGNYSESFRQQDASRIFNAEGNLLDPVIGEGIEAGVRMNFLENRLNASVSVFQIDLNNRPELIGQIEDPDFPGTFINAWEGAVSRSEGIEFKIQGNPSRAVTLTGGFSWKDVYNTSSNDPSIVNQKIRGYTKFTGTFSARDRVQEGALRNLNVGANLQVNGDGLPFYDDQTGLPVKVKGWHTLNLFTYYTWRLDDKFLTLNLNVRNVFDKDYIVTSQFTRPGDRRRVTLSASLRF